MGLLIDALQQASKESSGNLLKIWCKVSKNTMFAPVVGRLAADFNPIFQNAPGKASYVLAARLTRKIFRVKEGSNKCILSCARSA